MSACVAPLATEASVLPPAVPPEVLKTRLELTPADGAADIAIAAQVLALVEDDPTLSIPRTLLIVVISITVAIGAVTSPVVVVGVAIPLSRDGGDRTQQGQARNRQDAQCLHIDVPPCRSSEDACRCIGMLACFDERWWNAHQVARLDRYAVVTLDVRRRRI
jgi:hypothetical protein